MPDSERLALAVPAHSNQSLFSDHYLNEVLPSSAYWRVLEDRAGPVMEQIAEVFRGFTPSRNERQTEDNFVVPVLKLLGHTFEVQASLKTADGTKTPDYVFYANAEALTASKGEVLDDTLPQHGGVVLKGMPTDKHIAGAAVFSRGEGVSQFATRLDRKLIPVSVDDQEDSGWQLETDVVRALFTKLMHVGKSLDSTVDGRIYRGVLTGCNEAFIVDQATRDALLGADPTSADVLFPIANGEDVRPWYMEDEARYLIFTQRGVDIDAYPAIRDYLARYRKRLEPQPDGWDAKKNGKWPGRKAGIYKWYEIQDSIAYFDAFRIAKILWPEMAKQPRFALAEPGIVCNKTAFLAASGDTYLLGVLMSRSTWFTITGLCVPIGERTGMLRYTLSEQFMSRLPIPDAGFEQREKIGAAALCATTLSRERYALHCQARRRIHTDLGTPDKKLNQKLTAWWDLDFPQLRAELKKVFKADIPLAERDEWERWFEERKADHQRLTDEIIRLETDLNERVYKLFDLTPAEIKLIEESTKYKYGEV